MAKFKVSAKERRWFHTTLEVEANNEDDAREKVEAMWANGDLDDWTEGDLDDSFGCEAETISALESS